MEALEAGGGEESEDIISHPDDMRSALGSVYMVDGLSASVVRRCGMRR